MKKVTKVLPVVAAAALMVACGGKNDYENLVSQTWVLEKVEIADSTAQIDVPANLTIEFSDSSRVAGRAACNLFFGPYTVEKSSLKFGNLASTMMYCPEMPFESAYHVWLSKVEKYKATETSLELKDADGKVKLYYSVLDPTALEASELGDGATGATAEAAEGGSEDVADVTAETQSAE